MKAAKDQKTQHTRSSARNRDGKNERGTVGRVGTARALAQAF